MSVTHFPLVADWYEAARQLRIVDVWAEGNETGWVTPPPLYLPAPRGRAPVLEQVEWWIDHGTQYSATLEYFASGGSIRDGRYTCSHYLIPHEQTRYADGELHFTADTVFKMVPPGYAANHAGPCIGPIWNGNALGCEYESLQQPSHPDISALQLVKGALVYAHDAALHSIRDYARVQHGLVREPFGERADPWSGGFQVGRSWALVQAIRADERVWALWRLAQPQGGY